MTVLLGVVAVITFALTTWELRYYMFGVPLVADMVGSAFILSSYAAAGTTIGLNIAVFAILFWTAYVRLGRKFFGYRCVAVNGETSYGAILSGGLTAAFRWIRSSIYGLFVSGKHRKPDCGVWTVEDFPGVFSAASA